ncbi:hypothetical protein Pla52o_57050 [Novipirellula galeiformis]|uniref:Glycosyl hydrolase family 76 n=1 Tax=Novipirellula galeiformis TaxID=2528004 RepID=A0A5C6BFQ4_9BACT|nr:hypothetical protein [Novipirellula galeiformis]TWU10331.1 hypothetical protein Pla52o_57050 [Novipirellula galeiformis]
MKPLCFFITFTLAVSSWPPSTGVINIAAEETLSSSPAVLDAKMGQAWEVTWNRFFQKDVQTFADYLSSYEPGKELSHLPTAEEVRRQYPNPCGYGTGMEDGMILGGAMLSIITDMYAVTEDESLRESAKQVYSGVRLCATVHGVPGFLARNVCRDDRKSVYINSSRDQYTHGVHGLWKFYRSPLSDDQTKDEIRNILMAVADRMIQFVTPENDYDFCRADGQRCPLGICRMWNVQAHEAARLPMIYAAAWDVTADQKYYRQWRKYVAKAVQQSTDPDKNTPAYAILQMQCSLELLYQLEQDDDLKTQMNEVMQHLARLAEKRSKRVSAQLSEKTAEERRMLGPDWRTVDNWINQKGYPNPQWGSYREVWHLTREAGEAAMVPLMVDHPAISAEQSKRLKELIRSTEYLQNSSCGIIYHLGAYWKARLTGSL